MIPQRILLQSSFRFIQISLSITLKAISNDDRIPEKFVPLSFAVIFHSWSISFNSAKSSSGNFNRNPEGVTSQKYSIFPSTLTFLWGTISAFLTIIDIKFQQCMAHTRLCSFHQHLLHYNGSPR